MSFTDYIFFPFLLILVVLYYLSPKKLQWVILLTASVFFYISYGIEMLPFALGAVTVAWCAGILMNVQYAKLDNKLAETIEITKDEKNALTAKTKKDCKWILWLSIIAILGALVYAKVQTKITYIPILKYMVFEGSSFFVPLGISYYSLSLVGYLADVYWRKDKAEKNPFKLALFALYFPKILEGPISKHRLLSSQLNESHTFNYTKICHGLQRMIWGYFKKICIADRLSPMVTAVYDDCWSVGGYTLLMTAVAGAFWLYTDFSGCMDIALGISEIFGISIEDNFNRPFFSKSAAEFWRRWHITLGVWFKDYVYMPLVASPKIAKIAGFLKKHFGRRVGKDVMTIIPLVVVWLLTGIWHGTGINYVVWGVYWGVLIILSTVFAPEIKKFVKKHNIHVESAGFQAFRMLRTFILFVISRIISMTSGLDQLRGAFHQIFLDFQPWTITDQSIYNWGLDSLNFHLTVVMIIFLLFIEHIQEKGIVIRDKIDTFPIVLRWLIYLGGVFFVLIFGLYGPGYNASDFVYMIY